MPALKSSSCCSLPLNRLMSETVTIPGTTPLSARCQKVMLFHPPGMSLGGWFSYAASHSG